MSDQRNRILPNVYRTGNPIIDRNLDAIHDTFRRLLLGNGGGLDDHLVKARFADATAVGGVYDKTTNSDTVTREVVTEGGVEKVRFSAVSSAVDDHLVKARDADATAVGGLMEKTADSTTIARELITDSGIEKVRFNTTPPVPTNGSGSWLYTGSIRASNLHDPVKAFVKSLLGMGGLDPGQAELFTVLGNGDYEHKAVGQLYGLAPDGTETFVISVGQRVWLPPYLGSADSVYHGGFCTVQTLGDGSTKAVLRPTADVLAVGSMFKVDGSGAEFENWYWEVLSLPDMVLAYRPDYINATTYNLFTSTNVSRAGTVTRETSVTIPGGTSGGTMFAIPLFEMLDVLGVSKIPKGVVNWEIKAYVVSDDPAATIFIRAFLSLDQGILSRFGYGDTPPIHNTSAAVLRMQGTIPADVACSPTDKLSAVFYGYSNSASEVTIKLVYNDSSHSTRVQTPLEVASWGTIDHQMLTPTSRGFAPEGEDALAVAMRHRKTEIADNAPACYYISGETNGLTRTPGVASTKAVSTTDTSAVVFLATTPALDPWLDVLPFGNFRARLKLLADVLSYVLVEVKVGSDTLATSDWYPVPATTLGLYTLTMPAAYSYGKTVTKTDPITLKVYARTATGTGTLTVFYGGNAGSALTCPWQAEVSDGSRDFGFGCSGLMNPSEIFSALVAVRPIVIMPTGGKAIAIETVATASTVVTLHRMTEAGVVTQVGTVTMGAGARSGTVSMDNPVLVGIGESFYPKSPASPDATLAGFSLTLKGMLAQP